MAEIHDFDKKKYSDRKAALLALAATAGNGEKTSCLTDDEMASLVDNQCSPIDHDKFINHLAHCEICYRHWLELSEVAASENKTRSGKIIQGFFHSRNLAWAGSALAAAASIVLFLNLTEKNNGPVIHSPIRTEVKRSKVSTQQIQNDADQADSNRGIQEYNISNITDKATEPAKDIQASMPSSVLLSEKKQLPDKLTTSKLKTESMALGKTAQPHGRSRGEGKDDLSLKEITQSQLQIDEWIEKIQHGCSAQNKNPLFWEKMHEEGKQLKQVDSPEEKQLVKDLLSLIQQLQLSSEKSQTLCRQILQRLETNSGHQEQPAIQ